MDPVAAAALSSWSLNPPLICLILAITVVYVRGWGRLHTERPHKYTAGKLVAFASGLMAIILALASPIDAFGGLLLEMHMIQHLLLIMAGPPLLLLGQPVLPLLRGLPRPVFKDLLGPFFSWRELRQFGNAMVHPLVGWSAMATVIVVWHLPRFYELALRSPAWHQTEHACFFWAAMLFWWPVVGVWPSHPAWPQWAMIPYLASADFVNTGLSAVLCFSDHVLYPTYQSAPRLWGISALTDQAIAGAIMWVPGSIAFLAPAVVLVVRIVESGRAGPTKCRAVEGVAIPQVPLKAHPNLPRTPILGFVLQSRYFRRSVQTVMLLIAAAIAADGLLGPPIAPMNLAGVLPWTYWRGFAVIVLLAAGNLFCLACPFTLPRDLVRKFVAPRFSWPRQLRSKWLAIGLLFTYLWAYEAFDLWNSPRSTAWLVLGYFAAVLAVDSVFKGATFCKYVCPIGQFHFVHALVSPLEVKVREPAVCGSCTTYDCIRGNDRQRGCEMNLFQPKKTGNFDCTFCLDCVQACPHQNVSILTVLPGQSLYSDRKGSGIGRLSHRPDVATLALLLVFGAFVNAAGMTAPVMLWLHYWHARLGLSSMLPAITMLYLGGLLIIPGILVTLCGWANRTWGRASGTWAYLVCSFALAFVPEGFSMWLAHFSNHLLTGWNTIVPVAQRLLWPAALISSPLPWRPSWLLSLDLCFLDGGLLLTLYFAWRVSSRFSSSGRPALSLVFPWALLAAALYSFGVWTVFQPMQMRGMMMQ